MARGFVTSKFPKDAHTHEPFPEANLSTHYPVVEALNRELLNRLDHCLANFIVVQKLPHGMNLEVGHRQQFSRLDVLDHGAGNPSLSNIEQKKNTIL